MELREQCKAYCKNERQCRNSSTFSDYCLRHYLMYKENENKWEKRQTRLRAQEN